MNYWSWRRIRGIFNFLRQSEIKLSKHLKLQSFQMQTTNYVSIKFCPLSLFHSNLIRFHSKTHIMLFCACLYCSCFSLCLNLWEKHFKFHELLKSVFVLPPTKQETRGESFSKLFICLFATPFRLCLKRCYFLLSKPKCLEKYSFLLSVAWNEHRHKFNLLKTCKMFSI